eukprot:CAMPEP_0172326324 /NCGR_PEP_ID=MMETSP1058-20130122/56189_1 /TAXON_ID=83371 /ORGANISM="Detonula confervacea, Strain CCMP 353" /LENGTH=377 /DNA_ID=CAMNT_0013043077 /DNA_START=24 /DNA_END=1157 /DNA_ORIENTATION=-
MATYLDIIRLAACMTLLVCTHKISLSAAFVRQVQVCTPSITIKNILSANNRRTNCCFNHHHHNTNLISTAHPRRTMTTSLKDSQQDQGLSDIGKSTTKQSNEADDNDFLSKMPNWKERIDISMAKSRKVRGSNFVQISTINYETMEPRCRTVVFRGFLKGVPTGAVKDVVPGSSVVVVDEEGGDNNGYSDCVMKMITDLRSNKVQELELFHELKKGGENGNTVEMVWWFPKSNEQYRIRGRLQFIGNNGPVYSYTNDKNNESSSSSEQTNNYFLAERKQQWGNLSDTAREQFYWENPGIPFSSTWEQGKGVPPGGRDEDNEGKVLPPPDTFLLMLLYPTKIDYLRLGDNYRQVDEWDWGDADATAGGCRWKSMRVNP